MTESASRDASKHLVDAHNQEQIPPLIRDESGRRVPLMVLGERILTGGPGLRRMLKVDFEYLSKEETTAHVSCRIVGRTKEQLIEAKALMSGPWAAFMIESV